MVELDPAAVVSLVASYPCALRLDRVHAALEGDDLSWLGGQAIEVTPSGRRTFRCDLNLPVRALGRDVEFRKAALVELGQLHDRNGQLTIEVGWRSANLAPLFPVFAGQLTLTRDRIALEGVYAPPGGVVGVAIDRALLGMAARRTAAWFLRLVAGALGSAPAAADLQQQPERNDLSAHARRAAAPRPG